MPSVAGSHMRSSRSKGKAAAAPPVAFARTLPKPDAKMAALFRDEVKSMLSRPPPVPESLTLDHKTAKTFINGTFERRSSLNIQESVQFCTAVDKDGKAQSWVSRTEGDRRYFPRIAQVKKRLRDEDEFIAEEDDEAAAAAQNEDEQVTRPRKSSKKRASGSVSSSRRRAEPVAPKKTRRMRPAAAVDAENHDSDFDDGATTETEASHLARTRAGPSSSGAMLGEDGRGKRRCSARLRGETDDATRVKREHAGDDLVSLCGRVDGLGFRSTVEPDTDADLPGPSAPRLRKSGRFL
ncbi:hypothetical protein JCM3770_001512 [Rhodotorula araucariae]